MNLLLFPILINSICPQTKKVMLKIWAVGIIWEIENNYLMQVVLVLGMFDISSNGILKIASIGDNPINLISFGF